MTGLGGLFRGQGEFAVGAGKEARAGRYFVAGRLPFAGMQRIAAAGRNGERRGDEQDGGEFHMISVCQIQPHPFGRGQNFTRAPTAPNVMSSVAMAGRSTSNQRKVA